MSPPVVLRDKSFVRNAVESTSDIARGETDEDEVSLEEREANLKLQLFWRRG